MSGWQPRARVLHLGTTGKSVICRPPPKRFPLPVIRGESGCEGRPALGNGGWADRVQDDWEGPTVAMCRHVDGQANRRHPGASEE